MMAGLAVLIAVPSNRQREKSLLGLFGLGILSKKFGQHPHAEEDFPFKNR